MSKALTIVCLVVAVATALGVYLVRSQPNQWERSRPSEVNAEELRNFVGEDVNVQVLQQRTGNLFKNAMPDRSAEGEQVGRTVGQVVEALSNGDRQKYIDLLTSHGIDVDRALLKDDRAFGGQCFAVRDALFDFKGIEVRVLVRSGKKTQTPPSPVGTSVGATFAKEPRGKRDIVNAEAAGTDCVEVLIPAKLRSIDTEFVGQLGVVLTRRPADGVWLVTGYTIRNAPGGARLAMPPL